MTSDKVCHMEKDFPENRISKMKISNTCFDLIRYEIRDAYLPVYNVTLDVS